MMADSRYMPTWPLPSYIFIPGVNPHPKKSGGHMEGQADPIAPMIDSVHPEKNEFLRYSLDLFNYGYFWESHVYFEALWNTHKRQGSVADFLKAMIKLGAAGIKLKINEPKNASDHLERAKELIQSVIKKEGPVFLGFDLKVMIEQIDTLLSQKRELFQIHPEWPL